jgi:hypothetical protein
MLSEQAPTGAPAPGDQGNWLHFARLSLDLAMLLDRTKANALKIQLVRQIARGNSLGTMLCIRSLIEHRALVVWLPNAVGCSLDDLSEEVRAGQPLPEVKTAQLEQHLAKFLTFRAEGSYGALRPWTVSQDGGIRKVWLNLGAIVKEAFSEDDRFRKIYDLSSAVLHGRLYRGVDLAHAPSLGNHAAALGILFLERLCHPDQDMGPSFAAAMVAILLDHAARLGGTAQVATDLAARQVFGRINEPLVAGVDYSGTGSADDPFQIAQHLQFHQASRFLLTQLGVDLTTSRPVLTLDKQGRLLDRWHAVGQEYWFLVDHAIMDLPPPGFHRH